MIKRWIENLGFTASNDDTDLRRKHARRKTDGAVVMLGNTTYAVENWSEGGLLVAADDRLFGLNEPVSMLIRFKLPGRVIEIDHAGQIVRKNTNKVGIKFAPLTVTALSKFRQVIEDAVTREFAESQMA